MGCKEIYSGFYFIIYYRHALSYTWKHDQQPSKCWFPVHRTHPPSVKETPEMTLLILYNLTDDNATKASDKTLIPVRCYFTERKQNLAIFSPPQARKSNSNLENKHLTVSALECPRFSPNLNVWLHCNVSALPSACGGPRHLHIVSNTQVISVICFSLNSKELRGGGLTRTLQPAYRS